MLLGSSRRLTSACSVFAANRDEFLHRPTAKAHFWPPPQSNVLAGTDLEEAATPNHNGTWLGITKTGRFAALTNYRETKYYGKRSRGELVRDFLVDEQLTAHDYMKQVQQRADSYGGFSLVCINLSAVKDDSKEMVYFSNRGSAEIQQLKAGTIYGNVLSFYFFFLAYCYISVRSIHSYISLNRSIQFCTC